LERVASILNVADIFTKQLGPLLFRRHCDYLMGRVPPQYSSHYKNVQMLSNPERLQRDGACIEGEERWMPEKGQSPAAAAAKLVLDPEASDETFAAMWDIVTKFWHRNYEGLLL
jgi:hypothetical protein